jgi:hypothetical protein
MNPGKITPPKPPSPRKPGDRNLDAKTHEINVTLAVVTGLALLLLMVSGSVFGPEKRRITLLVLGPAIVALYLLTKRYLFKMPEQPPLIQPDAPITLIMGAAIPFVIVVLACACALWPGHDYSIAIIASAVFFGLTLESAMKKPG